MNFELDTKTRTTRSISTETESNAPRQREVDVKEVLDAFASVATAADVSEGDFSVDCEVVRIAAHDRAPISMSACPVCDCKSGRPTLSVVGTQFRVLTCIDCGLGQLHPRPTAAEVASFYPPDYYGHSGAKFEPMVEAMVRWVGQRHVRSLTRGLPEGAHVLDVGCGRGVVLGALADRGYQVHGFEISRTAAAGLDPRVELRIANSLSEARYPQHSFDQVLLWHVLEHTADPRAVLEEVRRILKPSGRLIVAVPNFSSVQARWAGEAWFHLDLPRHLFHFPASALRQLIQRCGFECSNEHHFSLRQNPFGWVQSALNRFGWQRRNEMYSLLKQSRDSKSDRFGPLHRLRLKLAYFLGMPLGIAASVLCACCRSGASIGIEAVSHSNAAPSGESHDDLDSFARQHPECFQSSTSCHSANPAV